MILRDASYSPAGYTWQELRILFEHLCALQHENSGARTAFTRISQDIYDVEHCTESFTQRNAFIYLSALASSHMAPLISSINNIEETHMHNRVYAAFSALHILYACTANPYPRYTTVQPLASFLALYVTQNVTERFPYTNIVLASFSKHMDDGMYKGIPELQHAILKYLHKIRAGNYEIDHKSQAVEACCYILSLI